MKSIGIYLRSKRRLLGLRISKVAEELKIKPEYIKAMENNRLDLLPTKAHQRVFLKSYAEYLGMDFEKIKKELFEEKKVEEKKDFYPVEIPKSDGGLFYLIFGLILGFIIVGFFLKSVEPKKAKTESETGQEILGPFPSKVDITPEIAPFFPEIEDKMLLRLEAFENSWLQVMGDGLNLFSGILGSNTAMEFISESTFVIRMGKPEVLRGFVNGQILKPFHLEENPKRLELNREDYQLLLDSAYIPKPDQE